MTHPNVVKFIEENGDHVVDDSGTWRIFETGAMLEYGNQYGALIPAFVAGGYCAYPENIATTLRNKKYFATKKLGAAIRVFEKLKKKFETQSRDASDGLAIDPTQAEIDSIHAAKAEVKRLEEMVNEIEIEINPPPKIIPLTAADIAARENSRKVLENIKNIEV